ncbi:hypothetical protein [uncultured Desulfovibrio sp.]|uniref:hypothetical protein n=1 Tax=uncultured Desulfovibrio sp. TaxID=167968 RepID=UPI0025EEFBB3|nr:hypothetical protein [uncultured Desulfovibrio sp.]
MPALTFSKWSSGGNTTLFLHDVAAPPRRQAAWARAVLHPAVLGAEQAGCVSMAARTLHMAGGEFCVNASRAFGALLALSGPGAGAAPLCADVSVSGWTGPVRLTVRGRAPRWEVSARLRLPPGCRPETHAGGRIVRLPGITHLLLPLGDGAAPPDLPERARSAIRAAGLEDEAAAGIIWWKPRARGAAMFPVVRVRDAGTLVAENACGSGALALALELALQNGHGECDLLQPSGSVLHVRLAPPGEDGALEAEIDGPVVLLARGRVWPDTADTTDTADAADAADTADAGN